jgi:hypothetical protein
MTLTEVGDLLRANPMAWRDIPPALQEIAKAALLPAPAFTAEQRHWFARWWLACTPAGVAAINALLPASTQVSATELGGALYLGSDLLTDSLTVGNTYYPAQAILQGLVCVYIEPEPGP